PARWHTPVSAIPTLAALRRPPPSSPPFPYTTLFRSRPRCSRDRGDRRDPRCFHRRAHGPTRRELGALREREQCGRSARRPRGSYPVPSRNLGSRGQLSADAHLARRRSADDDHPRLRPVHQTRCRACPCHPCGAHARHPQRHAPTPTAPVPPPPPRPPRRRGRRRRAPAGGARARPPPRRPRPAPPPPRPPHEGPRPGPPAPRLRLLQSRGVASSRPPVAF